LAAYETPTPSYRRERAAGRGHRGEVGNDRADHGQDGCGVGGCIRLRVSEEGHTITHGECL